MKDWVFFQCLTNFNLNKLDKLEKMENSQIEKEEKQDSYLSNVPNSDWF